MKITLRAHHLLCLKGFQGYGYSEDFVKNMCKINNLRKSAGTFIKLTDEPDDICRYCPNLKNNICENHLQNEKIVHMDLEVLKYFTLNGEYSSIELFNTLNDLFQTKESVSNICSECMWHDKCLFYQKL